MSLAEINKRYTKLAEVDCCLSCGGAINYAKAKPGEVCVDLGSGKGSDVLRLSDEVGDHGFVYGIDISEGMLQKARMNAEKFGIKNVEFICSPLELLPLPDKTVDLVISNCTINHASEKQKVWDEIFRILKMNGRFVVSDIYSVNEIPVEYRNDPVAVSECWAGSVTRHEYLNTLENAGFKNIEILEESAPYNKGLAEVVSFTIAGIKEKSKCACSNKSS
jgi:ubiquinone/menaquinone biosynthesis C-methylase UbiE